MSHSPYFLPLQRLPAEKHAVVLPLFFRLSWANVNESLVFLKWINKICIPSLLTIIIVNNVFPFSTALTG